MAVEKAKKDRPVGAGLNPDGTGHPSQGASGGNAPEGYGSAHIGGVRAGTIVEGVAQRGAEGDAKRFAEADKFQKSKVEAAKKEEKELKGEAVSDDEKLVKESPKTEAKDVKDLKAEVKEAPKAEVKPEVKEVPKPETKDPVAKAEVSKPTEAKAVDKK